MCSDDFAEFSSGCATCLNSSVNSTNITSNHYAYETGTDFFCSNENYICSFEHCISCFDSSNKTSCFYHT